MMMMIGLPIVRQAQTRLEPKTYSIESEPETVTARPSKFLEIP